MRRSWRFLKMEDKRTRYKTVCPECKEEFEVAHSIMMELGMNSGSCNCPKCKLHLHLMIDEKKYEQNIYEMIAEPYTVHVEKIKKERGWE